MQSDLSSIAREHVVDAAVAPGVTVAVAARSGRGWLTATGAAGHLSVARDARVGEETPFDLASVTKPIVAATVARLARRGVLSLEDPLGRLMPELARTPSATATLELLLSHRAGLDSHRTLYAPLLSGGTVEPAAALLAAAEARREDCAGPPPPDGFPPLYSDLGYLLVGAAASRSAGLPLAELVAAEVSRPLALALGSAAEWHRDVEDFARRVAATEVVAFRGGELRGVVHDENSWAVNGRELSGHAGLFGTAAAVAKFGAAFLDALAGRTDDWLSSAQAEVLVRVRPGGTLRAGFDGRSDEGSSAGSEFGPRSFGHLGFTGTSLWCDPDADVVVAVLTNRVNPTRENVAIRRARPDLHGALHRAALALRRGRPPEPAPGR